MSMDKPISDRIAMYGEQALSNEDLLTALLGRLAAQNLLAEFESLRQAGKASIADLCTIPKIGRARATTVKALFELARRLASEDLKKGQSIRSPGDLASMFMSRLRDLPREVFFLVCLDGRNSILCVRQMSEGSPTQAAPTIYSILHIAIGQGAAGIACTHNHPSGSTAPSNDDKRFTSDLKHVCDALQMKFIDHIIIGDNSFFSFTEAGLL